ncbi:hypothetical protein F6R98_01030 [Candidatus Methylospira mobilis]|uniref:Uncharacterized protein n=1 Tax=Candidatus Methylospira mobilis TaxID=1808979 RepID=A0A5Q0BCY0_9GAMM|nr:hypothetical protein [Candidatus Methylospira mobilis]QFY41379.1 hypothetical protein F6R98_01030 [Candidatus Methylospira mobilis]
MKRVTKTVSACIATLIFVITVYSAFPGALIRFFSQLETQTVMAENLLPGQVVEIRLGRKYVRPHLWVAAAYTMIPPSTGYPNLFQTADLNDGIRLEFSAQDAAVIYATEQGNSPGAVVLPQLSKSEKMYRINIEAVYGEYINIRTNGTSLVKIMKPAPTFLLNHILVGQGFDSGRKFTGSLLEFKLFVVEYSYNEIFVYVLLWGIFLGVIAALKIIPTRS